MRNGLALQNETDMLSWRISNWRRNHRPPATMPSALWEQAVDLASRLGVARTAKALRLDRAELRAAVERAGQPEFQVATAASFVNLFGDLGIELAECQATATNEQLVLELESGSGARMRIEATNVAPSSLLDLVRAFARG